MAARASCRIAQSTPHGAVAGRFHGKHLVCQRLRGGRRGIMSLLTQIDTVSVQYVVFRLASCPEDTDFLEDLGMDDSKSLDEMRELINSSGLPDISELLLDEPFRHQKKPWRRRFRSRYSDSSFPVFYASLEARTAEEEVKYHFANVFGGNVRRERTSYYWRFSCRFEGTAKDLRPMLDEWPDLIHLEDYRFCNGLGREARAIRLDAFLAPSARRRGGTNVPVFERRALSNVNRLERVSVTSGPTGRSWITVVDSSR